MIHVSPAPIEIARIPNLAKLAASEDEFRRITEEEVPFGVLPDIDVPEFEHLKQAAIEIGNFIINDIDPDLSLVDIRSGQYDPLFSDKYYLPFHFDVDQVRYEAVDSFMVCTTKAGFAVSGEARVKTEEELPHLASISDKPIAERQLYTGDSQEVLFDVTGMKVRKLKPSVLYKLPKGCLHCSPLEPDCYPRNFFRFKDIRA